MNLEFIHQYLPLNQEAAILTVQIVALGSENFFHTAYEETLIDTYGADYEDSLVVEGGVTAQE